MTATVQNAGSKSSQNRDKRLRHSGILKAVSFNERKNLHQLYASTINNDDFFGRKFGSSHSLLLAIQNKLKEKDTASRPNQG